MSDTSELDEKIDMLVTQNLTRLDRKFNELKTFGRVSRGTIIKDWDRGEKVLLSPDELDELLRLEGGYDADRLSMSEDLFERIQTSLRQSIAASISLKLDDSKRFFIAF